MLRLMSDVPEIGDHVLTVFSARRRRIFEAGDSSLVVRGAERDPAVARVASFLNRNRIPFREEAEGEPAGQLVGQSRCRTRPRAPSPVTSGSTSRRLLRGARPRHRRCRAGRGGCGSLCRVGGAEGAGGRGQRDRRAGGDQLQDRELHGLPDRHLGRGPDLPRAGAGDEVRHLLRHAAPGRGLSRREDGFCVTLDDGEELCARSVLVATGVQYRRLPLDRLEEFEGAGVYYAATEMEARFCAETEAVVVGGGNSAGQAAMYLSRVAKQVHVLVRGAGSAETMSAYLRERLEADPRITIHTGSQLERLDGEGTSNGWWSRRPRAVCPSIAAPCSS
jgi:thioredoxin reductase (NADPH)